MLSKSKRGAAAVLAGLALTLVTSHAMAAWDELNLLKGVTPISEAVYDLHNLMPVSYTHLTLPTICSV